VSNRVPHGTSIAMGCATWRDFVANTSSLAGQIVEHCQTTAANWITETMTQRAPLADDLGL
jgi:hypothetical protein